MRPVLLFTFLWLPLELFRSSYHIPKSFQISQFDCDNVFAVPFFAVLVMLCLDSEISDTDMFNYCLVLLGVLETRRAAGSAATSASRRASAAAYSRGMACAGID